MIEIWHEIIRHDGHFNEILCCECFFDEIYLLLRQKVKYEIFEEKFEKIENCFFDLIYGIIVVICCHLLTFVHEKKHKLFNTSCITDVIPCKADKIVMCTICTVNVFRALDVLHTFKLRW